MNQRRRVLPRAAVVVFVLAALTAPSAALEQPTGAPIPSDMGCHAGGPTGLAAALACECLEPDVCNIGPPCPSESTCHDGVYGTCETTLWHSFNDNTCIPSNLAGLDPAAEASTEPETFTPTCPLTFRVVTRGTAIFGDVFGWYNVTGSKPELDDLHVMLDCNAAPGTEVVLDVRSHPDYAGGAIGFFIATPENHGAGGSCAGGNCCASIDRVAGGQGYVYYSERRFNPDAAGADSIIHLVILDSHVTPRKFYFAWEDIYGGSNNDFTDLVTSVSGVECAGGGTECDTGKPGICSHGVSECQGGALHCTQLYPGEVETCDGLDNDCDGIVDDGATCPDGGLCADGRCVPHCEFSDEFDCTPPLVCDKDSGLCIDPLCVEVDCPDDEICRGGECVTPCEGVVCPAGTTCRFGDCIDPCEGVTCSGGEVCREGLCFPGCAECNGVLCSSGLSCDLDAGDCYDPSCPAGCPAGTVCDSGTCVDACEGAVCPNGLFCVDGMCTDDPDSAGRPDAGPTGGDGGPGVTGDDSGGCGCAKGTSPSESAARSLPLMLVGLVLLRRRRH